ncbi:MAG: type IV secretory system conjugative DNA transfer family protein [bacterium]
MSSHDENRVTYFGETDARNRQLRFGIKMHDRLKHIYAIGKTGMGKSTLLENMAIQDIQNGEGVAFIDPHGKSAELLLDYIPEHRIKDVVYFAPFDMEYPVAFNVMEDVGADRRHLVANGLMSAFKKIWVDAWSARMEYILNNIMLALLEFPGSTLLGVNRMLADKEFRNKVVANITDPSVRSFWVDEYAKYTDKFAAEAAPAIQNKVGQFVANPIIRNIIGQTKSTFDIRKMMDERKILIINLSKGRVGEANANLIGSMLVTKIYLAAMSRADLSEKDMKEAAPFYLYVDEFQSFANESFADILSEARKYKLSLTIAHQYIEQMPDEVRAAVFGNVGTMITFRVGATDGEVLEKEFTPTFTQEDLVNLGKYQMYLKLMIDGVSSRPFSARGLPDAKKPEINYKDKIIATSREQFARPRAMVEEEIKGWHLQRFNDAPTLVQNKDAKPVKPSGYAGAVTASAPSRPSVASAGFSNKDRDRLVASSQAPHAHQVREENRRPARSVELFKGLQGEPTARPHNPSPRDPQKDGNKMVLADAIRKATLEREKAVKEEIKIADDTKRKESETDLRQVISLSYLHNDTLKNDKNEKSAKPEQLNALRDLIADSKKPAPVVDVENTAPKPAVDVPPPQPKANPVGQSVVAHIPNKIREVPEDVLNDILKG